MVKNLPASVKRCGFDSWVRKMPWRRKWQHSPLQYPCLGGLMDRGTWQATVHGVAGELDPDLGSEQQQEAAPFTQSLCSSSRASVCSPVNAPPLGRSGL